MLDTEKDKQNNDNQLDQNNNIVGYRALFDAHKKNPGNKHGNENGWQINKASSKRAQAQGPGQLNSETFQQSEKS
jgi:hypothetical protein